MNAIYLLTYHILIRSKFYCYMGNYFDTYYLKFKKYEDLLIAPWIGVQKFLYSPDYKTIILKLFFRPKEYEGKKKFANAFSLL